MRQFRECPEVAAPLAMMDRLLICRITTSHGTDGRGFEILKQRRPKASRRDREVPAASPGCAMFLSYLQRDGCTTFQCSYSNRCSFSHPIWTCTRGPSRVFEYVQYFIYYTYTDEHQNFWAPDGLGPSSLRPPRLRAGQFRTTGRTSR